MFFPYASIGLKTPENGIEGGGPPPHFKPIQKQRGQNSGINNCPSVLDGINNVSINTPDLPHPIPSLISSFQFHFSSFCYLFSARLAAKHVLASRQASPEKRPARPALNCLLFRKHAFRDYRSERIQPASDPI